MAWSIFPSAIMGFISILTANPLFAALAFPVQMTDALACFDV
jgi:hypothetical protein